MANKGTFDRYLLALRETAINEKTEHTDRAALQSVLRGVSADCSTRRCFEGKDSRRIAVCRRGNLLGHRHRGVFN
jgi:hypothetical protein